MGLAKLLKEVANFRTGGHNVQNSANNISAGTHVDYDELVTNLLHDSAPAAQGPGSPVPVRVKPGNVGNTR